MDSQEFSIEISPILTALLVEHGCMAVLVLMLVVSISINMFVRMQVFPADCFIVPNQCF